MSAVAAKESKSRPSDPWKPEQSQRCPGVSGAVWQRRQSAKKFVVPVKSDLFRIVNPQSRTILARKVAKAAEALVSVVLFCFVRDLWWKLERNWAERGRSRGRRTQLGRCPRSRK